MVQDPFWAPKAYNVADDDIIMQDHVVEWVREV